MKVLPGDTSTTTGHTGSSPFALEGWKRAYPVLGYDIDLRNTESQAPAKAAFHAYVHKTVYDREAEAGCVIHPEHQPPTDGCECGFYVLKDKRAVTARAFAGAGVKLQGSSAVLRVALFGREVIEGAKGLRGSAQQVQQVTFEPQCYNCGEKGENLARGARLRTVDGLTYYTVWVLCDRCLDRLIVGAVMNLATLSGLLGVAVEMGPHNPWWDRRGYRPTT